MESTSLLDQLSADDRRMLVSKMTRRAFRKHDTLVHEGDPGDAPGRHGGRGRDDRRAGTCDHCATRAARAVAARALVEGLGRSPAAVGGALGRHGSVSSALRVDVEPSGAWRDIHVYRTLNRAVTTNSAANSSRASTQALHQSARGNGPSGAGCPMVGGAGAAAVIRRPPRA